MVAVDASADAAGVVEAVESAASAFLDFEDFFVVEAVVSAEVAVPVAAPSVSDFFFFVDFLVVEAVESVEAADESAVSDFLDFVDFLVVVGPRGSVVRGRGLLLFLGLCGAIAALIRGLSVLSLCSRTHGDFTSKKHQGRNQS